MLGVEFTAALCFEWEVCGWVCMLLSPCTGAPEPATPHYNNSILCDTVLLSHLHFLSSVSTDFPGMKDGLALLKVWLNQRQLSKVSFRILGRLCIRCVLSSRNGKLMVWLWWVVVVFCDLSCVKFQRALSCPVCCDGSV